MGCKFLEFGVFWKIWRKLVPEKIILKLPIREICKI